MVDGPISYAKSLLQKFLAIIVLFTWLFKNVNASALWFFVAATRPWLTHTHCSVPSDTLKPTIDKNTLRVDATATE
jgi:hypothetical protein